MCDPLTVAAVGLSIAQAGAGYMAANQAADQQNAYYGANKAAAVDAMNHKVLAEREAASQKLFQDRVAALKAQSTATVAAGEGGVTGLSVDALIGDFKTQLARQEEAVQTNFENQKQGAVDEGLARINSVRKAAKPSVLPYIISAAAGGVNALSARKSNRAGAQYAIE